MVNALNMRATSFILTKEYMDKVLVDKRAVKYMHGGLFAKLIFIIIRVVIASRLSIIKT
jgi:hypothetical protein